MNYNNLQVNYDGSIYQYSKDPLEGYQKHTSSTGKESYRKYYNKGVTGTLTSVIKKPGPDFRNGAEEVHVTLKQGEEIYILQFSVLNQNGDELDDFTQSLATILPKMVKGETYTVLSWYMKKGDIINGSEVKYSKKGITVKNVNGEKLKSDITYEYVKDRGTDREVHVKGDVPMLEWKAIAGKNRPTAASKEKQLEFLYSLLENQIVRLSVDNDASHQESPKPNESSQSNNDSYPTSEEEEDDLPF